MTDALDPNVWVTIEQGAALVGKSRRRVYEWVHEYHLPVRRNDEGLTTVRYGTILATEATTKKGRPRGVPTRR